jgi:hypothetical protein
MQSFGIRDNWFCTVLQIQFSSSHGFIWASGKSTVGIPGKLPYLVAKKIPHLLV